MELSSLKTALGEIGNKIGKMEERRKRVSTVIRELKDQRFKIGNLTDDSIINHVKKTKPKGIMGGVDGGLLAKSFHGVDIVMVRAVGVVFEYDDGKIKTSTIRAQKVPFVKWVSSENEGELVTIASIYRMKSEIEKSIEIAKDFDLDYLMLDGPLYPHPSTRVAKGSELKKNYMTVIKKYNELSRICKNKGTKLVGIVEDSRSNYFSKILTETIGPTLQGRERRILEGAQFRDTALLFDALNEGERTLTFKISGLQDLEYKSRVYGFYIKTARYDRPLRVEFISENPKKEIENVATTVYSVAAFPRYGLPAVLVEADLRAKLRKNYIAYIQKAIFSKSHSPMIMSLRREDRPL